MAPAQLSARKTAQLVLNQCDILRHDTTERLNQYLPQSDRPAQATDIVFGVIRNLNLIDCLISTCGSLEPARVKPSVWNLLRIGVYELVYAPNTAEYAIINEAVDLAVQKGTKKVGGFVNAVLRSVQKCIASRQIDISDDNRRNIIPQTPHAGCLLTHAWLPNPQQQPAAYFSRVFSLPQWLVDEWFRAYGVDQTEQICLACNRHPSVMLQPNTLRITAEQLHQKLLGHGLDCELSPDKIACCLKQGGKVTKIPEFLDGLFLIQDTTAAEAMKAAGAQPGWAIADLCAAPGGKSIALAMQMHDDGVIFASDSDEKRLQKVRQNADRMRLKSIEVVSPAEIDQKMRNCKQLDAIVLDVPCSNTGVLARRVEARHRLRKNDVESLVKTQQQLLEKAVTGCQHHTQIIYSTCSIQPQENQQQIQRFLSQHPQFILKHEQRTLPTLKNDILFDRDGGYVAVLQQNSHP